MHLPDGFLNTNFSAPLLGAAAIAVGKALYGTFKKIFKVNVVKKRKLALANGDVDCSTEYKLGLKHGGLNRIISLVGVGGLIFGLQFFDFSVGIGTGHFIGTALAVIVFGLVDGILLLSLVLMIQAFLLGDGGIIALGANITNMAVVGGVVAWIMYEKVFSFPLEKGWKMYLAAFVSAFSSVMAMAVVFGLYLVLSGEGGFFEFFQVHLIIGFLEGLMTFAVIRLIFPKLLRF